MLAHLPLLAILIPLIAAPACVVLQRLFPAWIPALGATFLTFIINIILYLHVLANGTFEYTFGGWNPPWGIAFSIDLLNAPIMVLLSLISIVTVFYARVSLEREVPKVRHPFFYSLLMLCVTGLGGIAATQDLFNAFVFMEIAALSSYALVGLAARREATFASFRYLTIGSVGTTFFLIGVSYLYMLTGTLNYVDMALRIEGVESSRLFLAGVALIVAGLAMKIALFPTHAWLPATYSSAPIAVTVFFSAISVKVPLYLLVRLYFDVFKSGLAFVSFYLDTVLVIVSALGIVYASWRAIRTTDVKKLLAFSSIGQVAYITLGVGLAVPESVVAAWIQFFSHSLTKGGIFCALGCVIWHHERTRGVCHLKDLNGLSQRAPWVAATIVVGGLGLIGVPLTSGFVAKWHLILALTDLSQWYLLAFVLLGSLLAVVYVGILIEAMYFTPATEDVDAAAKPEIKGIPKTPMTMIFLSWLLIGATLYFGIHASGLTSLAEDAVKVLL